MEYVFGTKKSKEILRTKGSYHSNLTGHHEIVREYPDQVITDHFYIMQHLDAAEDIEGNCYDWYEIANHYRIEDKTRQIVTRTDIIEETFENALCEQDTMYDERIGLIEDAICELDERIGE